MASDERVERFVKKFKPRRQDGLARKIVELVLDGMDVDEFRARARGDHDFVVSALERVLESSRHLSPNGVLYRMFMAKKFLRFLGIGFDERLIREQLDIPRKEVVKQDRAPSVEELRTILLHSTPRNRLLFHLIAVCGLRLGEALDLKIGDLWLNEEPPLLRVKTRKTRRFRFIPLTREIVELLRNYFGERFEKAEVDEYLFYARDNPHKKLLARDVQQYFYSTLKKAGLLKRDPSGKGYEIHLHSLRKFFKTQLESAGVNPLMIERWMGHNLGSVAQAYYRPSREQFMKEWRKAERALTIFAAGKETVEKYYRLEERIREVEKELEKLRRLSELASSLKLEP